MNSNPQVLKAKLSSAATGLVLMPSLAKVIGELPNFVVFYGDDLA